jgi:hypothetical protein
VEGIGSDIKRKIEEEIPKKRIRRRKWKLGEERWYDKEGKERKRERRRRLTKFRKGTGNREELMEEKKTFKQWGRQRMEAEEEKEMEKVKKIRTEQEAWKYINECILECKAGSRPKPKGKGLRVNKIKNNRHHEQVDPIISCGIIGVFVVE